jgi:hypothetical protein
VGVVGVVGVAGVLEPHAAAIAEQRTAARSRVFMRPDARRSYGKRVSTARVISQPAPTKRDGEDTATEWGILAESGEKRV